MIETSKMSHKFKIGDRVRTISEYLKYRDCEYEGTVIISERVKQSAPGGRPEVIIVTIKEDDGNEKWLNQDWFEFVGEPEEEIIKNSPDYSAFTLNLKEWI